MSHQYADLLSKYDNKGVLGAPELMDSQSDIESKAKMCAQLIREAKCCMIFTGAGISTAAKIPDFRGPNGIWTLEKKQKQLPDESTIDMTFEDARPTFTHQCLKVFERHGLVKFLLTQNVDGLHPRFGYPVNVLAEVHGNVFVERCDRCNRQYFCDKPLQSVGRRPIGKSCSIYSPDRVCRGKLCDFLLDWEDELPEPEFSLACKFAKVADLSICLGTSLQILPVANMPLLAKKNGGKFVTINLQKTKHVSL
jgi:mono-ADP-ribosyltransferase sirtuin 6